MNRMPFFFPASILLLFLVFPHYSLQQDCPSDCNGKGSCSKGVCNCDTFYSGQNCTEYWGDDTAWFSWFIVLRVSTVVEQSVILIFSLYQLSMIWIHSRTNRFSVITAVVVCSLLGAVCRILGYAVDPDSYYGIYPTWLSSLFFNLPYICWLTGGFSLLLYWIEIQQGSGIQALQGLKRLRPVLLGFVCLSTTATLSTGIPYSVLALAATRYTYFATLGLFIVCIVAISAHWGRRLLVIVNALYLSTGVKTIHLFMKKITWFLFAANLFLLSILFTMIVYVSFPRTLWSYVFANMVLRLEEFGAVFCMLMMVLKKKPARSNTASHTEISSKAQSSSKGKEVNMVDVEITAEVNVQTEHSNKIEQTSGQEAEEEEEHEEEEEEEEEEEKSTSIST